MFMALDWTRGAVGTLSEQVAPKLQLSEIVTYNLFLGLIAFILGDWLFSKFYITNEGRKDYYYGLIVIIFLGFKYLGAS